MDLAAEGKKINFGAWFGGLATLVTIVGGAVAIQQYYAQNPGDISGQWILEDQATKTSDSRYQNMRVRYLVNFVQNGNTFTGVGEKTGVQDEGKPMVELIGTERTQIKINGTVSRSAIHADFQDHGKLRTSDGAFDLKLNKSAWTGTFSCGAADSSGTSLLKRP
ncbi:MAG: hypothetical protein ABR874_15765 [Candidatus Sulfotelmatobacter sp.]|jgi:hypothetical protein